MAQENEGKIEVLVLRDQEGNYYGIPQERLEEYRLTEEQLAEARSLLGAEDAVSGYWVDERKLPPEDQTKGIMPVTDAGVAVVSEDAAAADIPLIGRFLVSPGLQPTAMGWLISLSKNARLPI